MWDGSVPKHSLVSAASAEQSLQSQKGWEGEGGPLFKKLIFQLSPQDAHAAGCLMRHRLKMAEDSCSETGVMVPRGTVRKFL